MPWYHALLLGVVEALTEFLPVSSTGHLLLVNAALGHTEKSHDTLSIVIQLGAVLAVVVYWRALLLDLVKGVLRKDPASIRLGLALGRGQSIEQAVREIGQVVESIQTAEEVMRQAERHGVELPISSTVRDVLKGEITPADGLKRLMSREQKAEYPQGLFR